MSRVLTAIGECQSAWQQLHDTMGATATMKYRHRRGEATIAEVIAAAAAESRALVRVKETAAALERLLKEIQWTASKRNRSASSPSGNTSSLYSQG